VSLLAFRVLTTVSVFTTVSVRFCIATACSSICLFFTAAKEATAKIYAPFVIVVNILYVGLLVLGCSSSAASSHYDGSLPYNGSYLGLLGMLLTWIQQGYAYKGIVDNAKRSKDLGVSIHLYSLMATIVTQFFSLFHSQTWFFINSVGVLVVYTLNKALYLKHDNKKKKKKKQKQKVVHGARIRSPLG